MTEQNISPIERSTARLLALIENTESAAVDVISFDPWAVAANDLLFSSITNEPDPENHPVFIEWVRQYHLKVGAQKVWSGPLLRSPTEQVYAATFCLESKAAIESGDGFAVMEAIAQCAAHGLVMPAWLAVAFVGRYQRVVSGACKGWGEGDAFGSAIPKGKNLAGLVAVSTFASWAYEVATELLSTNSSRPIDVGLYEEIGVRIGRKATQVQSLIRTFCKDDFHPPLKYVKAGLLAGRSLVDVFLNWENERHEKELAAIGFKVGGDGIYRKTNLEKL